MELAEKTGIPAVVLAKLCELAREYQVKRLILFGSRARGSHCPRSDIDLAVWGGKAFFDFCDRVEEETWTLLSFDIVNMNEQFVSEELQKEIERDGVVLYEEIQQL